MVGRLRRSSLFRWLPGLGLHYVDQVGNKKTFTEEIVDVKHIIIIYSWPLGVSFPLGKEVSGYSFRLRDVTNKTPGMRRKCGIS